MLALALTLTAILTMSSAARSDSTCFGFLGIVQRCIDDGPPPVSAGSFCKKLKSRKDAFTFTAQQIGTLRRDQREALASIKRDYRRECIDKERTK